MRNIDEIVDLIARTILSEEMQMQSDEKDVQDLVAKQIADDDLEAKDSKKKETITDEAEDDEAEDDEDDDVDVEAKPKPEPEEEEETGDEFEVQAPETLPASVHYSQIEKQINNLRAGKSLKDEKVSKSLEDYFDTLGQAEERALFTFLASISAILTGGTEGSDAPRPESLGLQIKMPKKKPKEKASAGEPGGPIDHAAPIIVGEVADRLSELSIVIENYTSADQHRCVDGQIVDFGSSQCITDITSRIDDMQSQRDGLGRGTADRSSLNGTLKYLRQKKRKAEKIHTQIAQEKVQSKLNLADSA